MTHRCNHTVQLTNERGERIGSWAKFNDGKRGDFIACRYCPKFYGRIVTDARKVDNAKERK